MLHALSGSFVYFSLMKGRFAPFYFFVCTSQKEMKKSPLFVGAAPPKRLLKKIFIYHIVAKG